MKLSRLLFKGSQLKLFAGIPDLKSYKTWKGTGKPKTGSAGNDAIACSVLYDAYHSIPEAERPKLTLVSMRMSTGPTNHPSSSWPRRVMGMSPSSSGNGNQQHVSRRTAKRFIEAIGLDPHEIDGF